MSVYKIADIHMGICPQSPTTARFLKDYLAEGASAQVCLAPVNAGEDELVGLFRQICRVLLYRFEGMYLHAAAVEYRNKVYLFVAPPGTGKSTHAALWKKRFGEDARILNGDKPLLRKRGEDILVYGNPWQGKEGWGENASGVLAGIYFLKRDTENFVEKRKAAEAVVELIHATEYPQDAEGVHKLLDFLEMLTANVPLRELHCTPELAAVDAVLADMERGETR